MHCNFIVFVSLLRTLLSVVYHRSTDEYRDIYQYKSVINYH